MPGYFLWLWRPPLRSADLPAFVMRAARPLLMPFRRRASYRINFFMNKFRKLGLIEYNGHLKVHSALLNVVVHD